MLERMKVSIDKALRDNQAGFRANRSCTDQVATLRIFIEQSIEWQTGLYLIFIDFQRAFDTVRRSALWKLLEVYGLPQKFLQR